MTEFIRIDHCDSCDEEFPAQEEDKCPECGATGCLISTWGEAQAERYRSGERYNDANILGRLDIAGVVPEQLMLMQIVELTEYFAILCYLGHYELKDSLANIPYKFLPAIITCVGQIFERPSIATISGIKHRRDLEELCGVQLECPQCVKGELIDIIGRARVPCNRCDGSCRISQQQYDWMCRGELLRRNREDADIGLREGAELLGMKASELSAYECGRVDNSNFNPDYSASRE